MNLQQALQAAEQFLKEDTGFRLGMLPTERSNPLTATFSQAVQHDTVAGLDQLLAVDRQVAAAARGVFASDQFADLTDAMLSALRRGGRIVFSGCGATGRLSLLLEAEWRRFWKARSGTGARYFPAAWALAERVAGVITGGDYALVRSLENFEDHPSFGSAQLAALGFRAKDLLIAVSEGGETPSVLGTIHEARRRGGSVWFVYNNPTAVLRSRIARSREVIEAPGVRTLELFSGEMAIAGSTRMQAVTFELLVLGAALGLVARRMADPEAPPDWPGDYATTFEVLLEELAQPELLEELRRWIAVEETTYRQGGLVTYFGHNYLLDLFTDTTERSPTFMLPPFRPCDDTAAPPSWAFVKDLFLPTAEAWSFLLGRSPRCLKWTADDYRRLGAPESMVHHPPDVSLRQLLKIRIGCEPDPTRCSGPWDTAILLAFASERAGAGAGDGRKAFASLAGPFARRLCLTLRDARDRGGGKGQETLELPCRVPRAPLRLWHHLAIKLVLNMVSTAVMGRLGRIEGNWMIQVHPTNKKLVDRGTRLIAELAGLPYDAACRALFESMAALAAEGSPTVSPVAHAIARLRNGQGAGG